MNGIFMDIETESITFVASDSHKLVRYRRSDTKSGITTKFILPKKPANLLKGLLPSDNTEVDMQIDTSNAFFSINGWQLICRIIEGEYPSYGSVIPESSPYKVIIYIITLKIK